MCSELYRTKRILDVESWKLATVKGRAKMQTSILVFLSEILNTPTVLLVCLLVLKS